MTHHIDFDLEFRKNPGPGVFLALEGIDGSGKTTQINKLSKYINEKGKKVVRTQEPTREGVVGRLVRDILVGKTKVPPVALQYLFTADRAVHQEEVIIPALEKGAFVISSRSIWSSVVYGVLDKDGEFEKSEASQLLVAQSILSMYHQFLIPDHAFYLKIPLEVSLERLEKKHEKDEKEIYEVKEKIEKMITGYDWLFENYPENVITVDGTKTEDEVSEEIIKHLNV